MLPKAAAVIVIIAGCAVASLSRHADALWLSIVGYMCGAAIFMEGCAIWVFAKRKG